VKSLQEESTAMRSFVVIALLAAGVIAGLAEADVAAQERDTAPSNRAALATSPGFVRVAPKREGEQRAVAAGERTDDGRCAFQERLDRLTRTTTRKRAISAETPPSRETSTSTR